MVIYIEYAIIDNMVINVIILDLLQLTFRCKITKTRKIIVSLIGTLMALGLPYVMSGGVVILLYKFATATIFVLFIKKYKSIKNFLSYFLLLFTYTFLIGGTIVGLLNLFAINYTATNILMYNFELPMGLILLSIIIIAKLTKALIVYLRAKLTSSKYLFNVVLIDGKCCANGIGMLDSGNKVRYNNKGVTIISMSLFMKLYKHLPIQDIFNSAKLDLRDKEHIYIECLTGRQKYLTFTIDSIKVDDTIFDDVRLALNYKNFEDFDCILSEDLIGVVK